MSITIAGPSAVSACAILPDMTHIDLMSLTDIAAAEARSERTITRWRASDPSFPRPAQLPCGGRLLFHRSDYQRWRVARDANRADQGARR